MNDISSLKKKLAGYSAMAGAMIAANNHSTEGQVIYHDIDPDTVLSYYSPTYHLDLNNDGIAEFGLSWSTNLGTFDLYGVLYLSSLSAEVLNVNYGFNLLEALNSCQPISAIPPNVDHWFNDNSAFMIHGPNNASPWANNGADSYAGLKFHLPDGYHYGWIRMTCIPADGYYGYMTLKDYAYQSIPDSSIITPCAQQVKDITTLDLFSTFLENHQLIIQFHQSLFPSRMMLFNDAGLKLNEQSITQSEWAIDVSHLAAGIYFVMIDDNEQRQVKKVVIE